MSTKDEVITSSAIRGTVMIVCYVMRKRGYSYADIRNYLKGVTGYSPTMPDCKRLVKEATERVNAADAKTPGYAAEVMAKCRIKCKATMVRAGKEAKE